MFLFNRKIRIETERLILRAPVHSDYRAWVALRSSSREFLTPWEPTWSRDHLTRKAFTTRVNWAQRLINEGTGMPLFMARRSDNALVGAITLSNIRRGPAQAGTMGYWVGVQHTRQGYMREALTAMVNYAFTTVDISRIESACLPENKASRGVLEKCGYKYEGVAQAYLQINGRWRTHVLYAALRNDRRGRTSAG